MYEIRFHGRGGQGAVTSAELLALAAIGEGRFGQAFPSFGPERRGAPVMAYARVADAQILNRSAVYNPNGVIVLDPSLLKLVDVAAGLAPGGTIVVATHLSPEALRKEFKLPGRVATVDALTIAMQTIRRPITNTTMLGAFIKATAEGDKTLVGLDSLESAVKDRFGRIASLNIHAFRRAYEDTVVHEEN
ncbi:MAG: 2-oxoacid:acceptor oxidoreductase family protein [Polyangia bacterium]|jgi:pyruvate ferredoxin oxidoreductase gamma subunit|nr:2-oxoacid:acceptor oxidoreductase family protein [Polyangia bacterium]